MRMLKGILLGVVIGLCACAPTGPSAAAPDAQRSDLPRSKVLTIAIAREPSMLQGELAVGYSASGGITNVYPIVHDRLVVTDQATLRPVPHLALELPSVEKGSWRVNADGTMDLTWRIRPDVKWHDGRPFTTGDIAFSFAVFKDPVIPNDPGRAVALMESVSTPDPHTLVVHWSKTYNRAEEAPGLNPMARHLLQDLYLADPARLPHSTRFTTEYVGLGAYRLTLWEQGSHMEFARFDDYYLGRPAFDRVVLRFLGDPNTMIANALAGSVDVVLPTGLDVESALEVKRQWEGTGNQVLIVPVNSVVNVNPQHRPEYARPRNGLTNVAVRKALYQAIDRHALVDVVFAGLAPVADSYVSHKQQLRPAIEDAIPQYPYDPRRAQELLAGVGWARGGTDVLVHQPSGERFEVQLRANVDIKYQKLQGAVADFWKQIGAQVEIDIVPTALANDREHRLSTPGAFFFAYPADSLHPNIHSREVASPANRWTGGNHTGYSNPRVDELLEKLDVAIIRPEQISLHRQLVHEEMEDLAVLPLLWRTEPVLALKGIGGLKGDTAVNIIEWDKD